MPSASPQSPSTAPVLVVGGVTYGDRSRIVRLLTKEDGLVPLWVANATKHKALWHPMALLEMVDLKPGKGGGLWTAREWRRSSPQVAFRREPMRSAVGFFIAEVLAACLEEGAPTTEVHSLSLRAAHWLEHEQHVPWIHVKFMAELVQALGMMPDESTELNRAFDIATGEYVPLELAPKTAMDSEVVQGMRRIVGMEFGEMGRLDWPLAKRKELVLGAYRFVQAQLGKSRELKSYDVLEALFA